MEKYWVVCLFEKIRVVWFSLVMNDRRSLKLFLKTRFYDFTVAQQAVENMFISEYRADFLSRLFCNSIINLMNLYRNIYYMDLTEYRSQFRCPKHERVGSCRREFRRAREILR